MLFLGSVDKFKGNIQLLLAMKSPSKEYMWFLFGVLVVGLHKGCVRMLLGLLSL